MGVNIEGMAAKGGRLFFGFRGPAQDKQAPLLAVDAAGLFEGGAPNVKVTKLEVGEKRGIRDLHPVSDGLLVLAGPDDDSDDVAPGMTADWVISHWNGSTDDDGIARPKPLGRLNLAGLVRNDCDKEIKPEALAVLQESPSDYRVLILSDGRCDGGPIIFSVAR